MTQRACILSPSGTALTPDEVALLAEYQPFGMIVMGRSCHSPAQLRRLVDQIWEALDRPCLVFVDQEGGRVARLKPPHWPTFPAFADYGKVYARSRDAGLEAAFLGHRLIAGELAGSGIHADCAPVADLRFPGASSIIGDRSGGADPRTVADLVGAALDGLAGGGVAGVIKHIPGHGRATVDSHKALPVVDVSREALMESDFVPFTQNNSAPMAMTAHVVYTAYDAENPATTSSTTIERAIRGDIGFDGLLMSDDLGMKALPGSLEERAEAALAASCDVVLYCGVGDAEEMFANMRRVAGAALPLEGRAFQRAQAAEAFAGRPVEEGDLQEMRGRLSALLAGS